MPVCLWTITSNIFYKCTATFRTHCISRCSATYFGEEGKISELVMRSQHASEEHNPAYEKHLSFIIGSCRGNLLRQFASLRVNEPIKSTATAEEHRIKSSSK
jgi:hypothetical protein